MANRDVIIEHWSAKDLTRAVLAADREFVRSSASLRALIVDLVTARDATDELFDACALLGRMLAQLGGSPTMASATLDHASDAIAGAAGAAATAGWLVAGRAALAEGFASALVEDVRRDGMRSWEFPHCAVPLGQASLAVAAGHPSDDDEVLAAWAARVANAAALQGIRKAVTAGNERARAALIDALRLVGIEVR
jgi:hypothetical protein